MTQYNSIPCRLCEQESTKMIGSTCRKCYDKNRKRECCVLCGKMGRVNTRDSFGNPHCHACYQSNRPKESCAICGKMGKVNQRLTDGGAVCPRCYDKRSIHRIYADNVRHAPKRGYEWRLDFATFQILTMQPCHYCGIKPDGITVLFLGIDRKDNTIGYIQENCLPCCWLCNKAKSTMGHDEFIALCHRVVNHQKGPLGP
jgi:hypothetical protein